jgi:3,4-dihydroxy-2-butanone 4-phosphate synthase
MAQVKFISGDGVEHEVEDDSMAAEVMRNAGFQQIGVDAEIEAGPIDLSSMKKAELLAYAEGKGIEVNPKAKVADIIATIEEAEANS